MEKKPPNTHRKQKKTRRKSRKNTVRSVIGIGVIIGVVFAYYLFSSRSSNGSGVADVVPVPTARKAASYLKNPFTVDRSFIAKGKKIYTENCQVCHGPDGRLPRSHPFSQHAGHHPPGDYMWLATNGIPKKGMPAWKDKLTYEERWQVITYIQRTFAGTEPHMMR